MKDDAVIVEIGDEVLPPEDYIFDFSFPEEEGKPNPHLWTDPTYAIKYAEVIADTFSEQDPDNADYYAKNLKAFTKKANALSDALRADQQSVPDGNLKLLTYHDAYAYFAQTYGWDVIGAVQPKNFEDPTPQEVATIIDQVEAEDVPTIFGSEVFPSAVLEEIGRATGARYEDTLRDDDLPGEPGDAEHSWLGLMRYDYMTMIEGLGGARHRARVGGRRRRSTRRSGVPAMTATGVGPVILTLDDITVGYEHAPVLRDVSFHVHSDQFTGIVGPSGSGKTTLLRTLLGALRPQRGTVTTKPGLRMAYVPQLETVNWNFPVTVFECVLMARTEGRQWPRASRTDKADVAAVLERLGIAELADRHIRQLSGGQQQRMFIARALLSNPDLLVLDEPTSGVDVSTRHDMLHLLADLHEDGISIVLTTHDLNGMAAHLPHLVTINGKIIAEGTPARGHHVGCPRAHLRCSPRGARTPWHARCDR